MTQFLLVSSPRPYPAFAQLAFTELQGASFLARAAKALFAGRTTPTWSVAAPGLEAGDLAYEAQDAVLAGRALERTVLGRLLRHVMDRGDGFALFYAADHARLPQAKTPQDLLKLIDEQLRTADGSNLELYAHWP